MVLPNVPINWNQKFTIMASLKKRSKKYIIQFSKRVDGKIIQKSHSLGTNDKRIAERLKIKYEDMYEHGEIDPFSDWSPAKELSRKRDELEKRHMNLETAANKFIEERSQANEVTKKGYRTMLNILIDSIGGTLPISMLKAKDIRDICFRPDLANATQRSYLRHYKVFFKWLFDNKYTESNIIVEIKPPKPVERIVDKIITKSDLHRLFHIFDQHIAKNIEAGFINHENQKMHWFKPMISTFYYTGLRSKELINLRWTDINEDFKFLLVNNSNAVTTKSGKVHRVPIRKPLAIILKDWKKMCNAEPDDYVFSNVRSVVGKQKMSSTRISHTFKRFARMANLPEYCNIHGLRHSFGTDLLRKGVPINEVSEMMGHSSIEVTKIYQHLTSEDLYESVKDID